MSTTVRSSINKKQAEVEQLKAARDTLLQEFQKLSAELSIQSQPKDVVSLHIQRLKEYNELRDTGLRLTQLIADEKRCKVKEVFEEMGYDMIDY
ncbi:hypothetical protein ZYGR_0N04430 [Zygosaccharomyces rouxii]|uniref:ZYRO0D10450p n=2 Tax=Zygosaccharomyces rouxii TaxID=4956 RepID=C5DVY7_ZYGRC|nr:uncharacterized protein ZYRO0D10450g [Zygosaccharomyces rouxii]GAV49038.1 hypothetical protein ZYGR_0N04430 [Zygosaccharomyces rouxii]CAR27956.1 ZYRO0D10450p [Zygosaccharomyces rouxii]